MIKIVYIANARIPTEKAHGIQIMKTCEAFANAGLEDVLQLELMLPWRFNGIKENPFDYYGVKKNFIIKKLFSLDLIFLGIPRIGFWVQNLSFAILVLFYLLFKKSDLIYSRDPLSLFFLSYFMKSFVYEAHSFPRHFFLYKRISRKAKAIIVISHKLKDLFIEQGIAANKILVAPDSVDLKMFDLKEDKKSCRQRLNLPLEKKIVLYTGHLFKWKGVQVLAEAAKYLDRNYLVVFVGGTKNDIIRFKIKNANLKNIFVVGYRPYREIPYWLKSADILALPNSAKTKISRDWTSPMKMFEYMASQRPIIASDLPSLREILNKNNAILVSSDNPKEFAAGIKQILKDPLFSDRISKNAFSDVSVFTWSKRAKKILYFLKVFNEK